MSLFVGIVVGCAGFYLAFGKRWREERGDYFMLSVYHYLFQGQFLHANRPAEAAKYTDGLLTGALWLIDNDFKDHPGAHYWVKSIEKYASDNNIKLSPEDQAIVAKFKKMPDTNREFYRWY
jgi:hypothetical protein